MGTLGATNSWNESAWSASGAGRTGGVIVASEKERIEEAAVTGVGAGVGGAGGATLGVIELAATPGTVTGVSAGVVIGVVPARLVYKLTGNWLEATLFA